MGADVKQRPSAFEEAFDVIKRLLAGEKAGASRRFRAAPTRLALRPAEPVEYWIAASAEPAIDRASWLGDGWLGSPGLTPEVARAQLAFYRGRCAARGWPPAAIALRRDIYVGDSTAEAEAVAGPIVAKGYRGFPPEAPVWGSVGDVIERFRAFGAMGFTDIIVRHLTDDQPKVLASLARLREVREALKGV
jgi:alkanesulfonate monooxygenase SsuD/methylene tetrahydromethanopterin reductase-like flavin-dependent oxidoreductase (luciferase family)